MEFRTKMNCAIKMVDATPSGCNYVVLQELLWDGKSANKYYDVHYDAETGTITCSCQLFEFRGIVCRHCFTVLGQEEATTISTKYIIPRWSKLIRKRYTSMRAAYNTHSKDPTMQRYRALCKNFFQIADVACESDAGTKHLFKQLRSGQNPVEFTPCIDAHNVDTRMTSSFPAPDSCQPSHVRSPNAVKRKGRLRTLRLKSKVEKFFKKKEVGSKDD